MKTDTPNQSRRSFLGFLIKAPVIPVAASCLPSAACSLQPLNTAPPVRRSVLLNDFKIAGFRYYDGPGQLPALAPGAKLTLRAQPANPYDAFAVEIFHGPVKLGYVPRFCNRHLSRLLLDGVELDCEADAISPQAAPWDAVAVNVYLPLSPPTASSSNRDNPYQFTP